MEKLNVAIADDNEKMVEVLGQIIEEDKDLELVGKAHNGEEICNIIREKEPDVVVLDIIMPKMDGLAVMEKFANDKSLKKIPRLGILHALSMQSVPVSRRSPEVLPVLPPLPSQSALHLRPYNLKFPEVM